MPSINLSTLTFKPYGVETFTDLERGKEFTTLYYRHKTPGTIIAQFSLVTSVLADIARAGFTLTDPVKVELSPFGQEFRCHLEISVKQEVTVKEAN